MDFTIIFTKIYVNAAAMFHSTSLQWRKCVIYAAAIHRRGGYIPMDFRLSRLSIICGWSCTEKA